jgi:hypothetical protein
VTTLGGLACGGVTEAVTTLAGVVSSATDLADIFSRGTDAGWNNVPIDAVGIAVPVFAGGLKGLQAGLRIPAAVRDAAQVAKAGGSFWNDALGFGSGLMDWNG